jgi:hypothetical protein
VKRIEPKGVWMMVDGLNIVEGPDHRGYVQILSWHDDEPPGTVDGMPVGPVDDECEFYEHGGREWLYLLPAPDAVSERKMPE